MSLAQLIGSILLPNVSVSSFSVHLIVLNIPLDLVIGSLEWIVSIQYQCLGSRFCFHGHGKYYLELSGRGNNR